MVGKVGKKKTAPRPSPIARIRYTSVVIDEFSNHFWQDKVTVAVVLSCSLCAINCERDRTFDRHSGSKASTRKLRSTKILIVLFQLLCSSFQSVPIININHQLPSDPLINWAVGTMTTRLKERAWQSGLFLSDETTEWNNDDWPPLEGGARYYHASVVLNHPDTDNNNKRQTVVVLGGHLQGQRYVNSVRVLDLSEANKKWRAGTPMNKTRYGHAAVVCNGGIYVMGGYSEGSCLNCIERIDASRWILLMPTITLLLLDHP